MSKSTPGAHAAKEAPSPLAEALDRNQQATAEVKRAADDLAVVHAVLDTKIAHAESDVDVKRAVAETDKLEKRLERSAEKLDQVNETLAREVKRAS